MGRNAVSLKRWAVVGALSVFVWLFETLVVIPALNVNGSAGAEVVTWAIVFDCVFIPAALAFWIIIRGRHRSLLALLPIFALGIAVATFILPANHRSPVHALRFVIAPLELSAIGVTLWRVGAGLRRSRASNTDANELACDFETRLRAALPEACPPALRLVAAEIVVWYYGLLAWRIPTPPDGDVTFGVAGETGGLAAALLAIGLFEGVAEHLILWQWSPRVDLALLTMSAYGVLYLCAELNALRLRPMLLTADCLQIRTGLRWRIDAPYSLIAEIRPVLSHARRKPTDYANAVGFGRPNIRLHLTEPVTAHGPFGIRRQARYIALRVDRPDRFQEILAWRCETIMVSERSES